MKLLIFAHTPPPHHGQSYMVELMLAGFGGDQRKQPAANPAAPTEHGIACYHVNARVSKELEDIGDFRLIKLFLLVGYCLQAIWCRFRHGVTAMYYIPAPGKRSALYRDWLVMLMCRPFFKRVVLHWHAAGLANWLETSVPMIVRSVTYKRMRNVDLSIVLSSYNRADAEKLFPRRISVVSNGIPDPCPDFTENVHPRRQARFAARRKLAQGGQLEARDLLETGGDPHVCKVLYLAHCTRDKGLFDAMKGVALANAILAERNSPMYFQLIVAGSFVTREEQGEFEAAASTLEGRRTVRYEGFVSAAQKQSVLREADLFCFPTHYQNENQPVNLIEAMAYGLPILTTRWRSIPELLPPGYPYLVDICSPDQIADALVVGMTSEPADSFREIFLRKFNLEQHLTTLAAAFHSIETTNEAPEHYKPAAGLAASAPNPPAS